MKTKKKKVVLTVRMYDNEVEDAKRLTYEPKAASAVAIAVRKFIASEIGK